MNQIISLLKEIAESECTTSALYGSDLDAITVEEIETVLSYSKIIQAKLDAVPTKVVIVNQEY